MCKIHTPIFIWERIIFTPILRQSCVKIREIIKDYVNPSEKDKNEKLGNISVFRHFKSCLTLLNLPLLQPYKNVRFQQRNVSENDGCTFLFLL